MNESSDLADAYAALSTVYGLPAWGSDVGYGSFLTVEFGPRVEKHGHTYGAHHLWIYLAAWRIERGGEMLVASEDDDLAQKVEVLNGRSIQKIIIDRPSLSAVFEFDQGVKLITFSLYTAGEDHWMLFLPDGNVFTAGPGSAWSVRPAGRRSTPEQ